MPKPKICYEFIHHSNQRTTLRDVPPIVFSEPIIVFYQQQDVGQYSAIFQLRFTTFDDHRGTWLFPKVEDLKASNEGDLALSLSILNKWKRLLKNMDRDYKSSRGYKKLLVQKLLRGYTRVSRPQPANYGRLTEYKKLKK